MRSKRPAGGARSGYTDTAAAIGDLDHMILMNRELIARLSRVMGEWGRAAEKMQEGSADYEKVMTKIEAVAEALMVLFAYEDMLLRKSGH